MFIVSSNNCARGYGGYQRSHELLNEFKRDQRYLGRSVSTIKTRVSQLRKLAKDGADLYNPESVQEAIYNQKWVNKRKNNAVDAYNALIKIVGVEWEPPKYQVTEKTPFIPLESELDDLIAGTGKKTSALLRLLKETAVRIGEVCMLTWDDIDFTSNVIRVTPEKGSNARTFNVSNRLMNVLASVRAVNQVKDPQRVFAKKPKSCRRVFSKQRDRLAVKLQNPRLNKITFHTFRHWKGTEIYHRTKSIEHTKKFLGHKSLINTEKYIHLEEAYYQKKPENYVTKVAKCVEDAVPLIEQGFEEASDFDGVKIFKKLKSSVGLVN